MLVSGKTYHPSDANVCTVLKMMVVKNYPVQYYKLVDGCWLIRNISEIYIALKRFTVKPG